ncbi:glycosyl transferase [Aliishimia ponticola]|uniref:Peptide O-xylosyltransferase n=1 Tax=Aliishimia ponticola TaxID=2499833 RepID=A0A4S4N9M1_9RHOB|nr:beta-1,6-N-acetylglucosaminyltransferase [Aliishimia ponticola]THH34701.1 glycosyl transferase [Aliishimia ponticola]
MSTLGIVMLVHTALGRAEQVAKHWAAAGCPVVIHVDRKVPKKTVARFRDAFAKEPLISFSKRFRCEWGGWGIVAASQAASEQILRDNPDVRHVYLASGSCLPLRPVSELIAYLDSRPQTDFIESATTEDVPWIIDGLGYERFTLRFPFAWKKHRYLFDRYVKLQRLLRLHRKMPMGLVPHMGSQWWCLTRQTLTAILQDPERAVIDRFFRQVWIPDESYFQTLARQYAIQIESRSLTLSKFDFQGKPHIFYDDHLQLLRRSDCFVARKIWPHAHRLYETFLTSDAASLKRTEPNPGKIDRIFSKAVERRMRGRAGLYMQSRFPVEDHENGITAAPYSVFQGFSELFENFEPWLARSTGVRVHGHLFDQDGVHFAEGQDSINGALTDGVALRDYNPAAFLTNLIWNTRGERQCFQYGPRSNQDVVWRMSKDPNAQISVITGAWAIPLFRSNQDFQDIRKEVARLQQIESEQLDVLRSRWSKARIRIWSLAEFIEAPMEPLQGILDEINPGMPRRLAEAPRMVDLRGFGQFLQNLKNQGMHPYLMGDFRIDSGQSVPGDADQRKPYLVR